MNMTALTVLTTALLSATPALAGPPEVNRIVVSTADLDLTTTRGVAQLHQRIAAAADTICDARFVHTDTDPLSIDNCLAKVRARTATQVNSRIAEAHARRLTDVAMASR